MHLRKIKIGGGNLINVVFILSSFIISLVVAIVSIIVGFNAFQTVATTMLAFLCSEYFMNTCLIKSKYLQAKSESAYWENAHNYTNKLKEINEYCMTVLNDSHGEKDLFNVACSRSIDNLHYQLRTAAQEKRIEITSDYIINAAGVFEALNFAETKSIELTFPIEHIGENLIDTAEDRKFFEIVYKMVVDKQVESIKVLLILDDVELIGDQKIKALFDFYAANEAYECKYIKKADFLNACEHNLIATNALDFGIYGPKMLFCVEQYDPYCGVYSKNEAQVKRYTDLFNEVWNFEWMAHENPSQKDRGSGMTPKNFFELLENNCPHGKNGSTED